MHSAPSMRGANPRHRGSVVFRIAVKIYTRQDIVWQKFCCNAASEIGMAIIFSAIIGVKTND
ncbi:hypothetical protein Agau_L200189 [Agrobacterium tumefaciens F2]|nr:hypothetical protein Agau_L200189 [Agrobacterium tumefaciens F2]